MLRDEVTQVWTGAQLFSDRRVYFVSNPVPTVSVLKMEWTEEITIELIAAYENKPILWDAKHPHYYNRHLKNDAWQELAQVFRVTIDECKRKISALLSALRRERSKINKSTGTGKGADEIYRSNWFAFNHLKFLWDKNKPRDTHTTMDVTDTPHNDSEMSTLLNESDESSHPPVNLPEKTRKRSKQDVGNKRLDMAFHMLESATNKKEDESDLFGKFVATKLKKYSDFNRSVVQQEIMAILFNADRNLFETVPTSTFIAKPLESSPYLYSSVNTQSQQEMSHPRNELPQQFISSLPSTFTSCAITSPNPTPNLSEASSPTPLTSSTDVY